MHTTHIPPGSSNGWVKVEMLEGIAAALKTPSDAPSILCGDFNIPQHETSDGAIITWGQDIVDGKPRLWRRYRGGDGHRWDAAERTVMEGGPQRDLVDAFRRLHGYGREDFSWFVKRKELRIGRRFDHAFCSKQLILHRCEYLHNLREEGLSDHSALELDFDL